MRTAIVVTGGLPPGGNGPIVPSWLALFGRPSAPLGLSSWAQENGSQRTRHGRRAVHEACELATSVHVCTKFMAALAHAKGVDTTIIPLTSVTSQAARLKSAFARRGESTLRIIQVASLNRVKKSTAPDRCAPPRPREDRRPS